MIRSLRLPKSCLLRKAAEFKEVYRRGQTFRGSRIKLFVLFREPEGTTRAGFSTVRRVRKAVTRNRARRLMREVFRLHREELLPGLDLVLLWTGTVEGWGYRQAEEEILGLWGRAEVMRR